MLNLNRTFKYAGNRIYVHNIPLYPTKKEMYALFSDIAPIKDLVIVNAESLQPYCILDFNDARDADLVFEAKNGEIFKGCKLKMHYFPNKHEFHSNEPKKDQDGSINSISSIQKYKLDIQTVGCTQDELKHKNGLGKHNEFKKETNSKKKRKFKKETECKKQDELVSSVPNVKLEKILYGRCFRASPIKSVFSLYKSKYMNKKGCINFDKFIIENGFMFSHGWSKYQHKPGSIVYDTIMRYKQSFELHSNVWWESDGKEDIVDYCKVHSKDVCTLAFEENIDLYQMNDIIRSVEKLLD